MPDHTRDIRRLREQSNAAIAARDVERVVSFMSPDVVVAVAAGPTLTGIDASRQAFAEQFADRAFGGYVRTPADVTLLQAPVRAVERGRWTGRWHTKTGIHEQGGAYVAEWQPGSMGWMIVSERYASG